jgi:antitoxin component YwqK of YwqJK toxin-antitoxin module
MKLVPNSLVALSLLVGCSDGEKIKVLEQAMKAQDERLVTLQEKQLFALKQKEEVARLKKERAEIEKELKTREVALSEAEKLQIELDVLKKQLAVTGGGEKFVERYKIGQKKLQGYMLDDGKKVGHWTYWHENGRELQKGEYKDGKQEGLWTYWHENGQKKEEGEWEDRKQVGNWTYWHDNGQREKEGEYKDSKPEGLWTYWHENGQKHAEGRYKDDKQEGNWTIWHDNGEKDKEGEFKDGKMEGLWTFWHENIQGRVKLYLELGAPGISQALSMSRFSAEQPWIVTHVVSSEDPDQPPAIFGVDIETIPRNAVHQEGLDVVISMPAPSLLGHGVLREGDNAMGVQVFPPGSTPDATEMFERRLRFALKRMIDSLLKDIPEATYRFEFTGWPEDESPSEGPQESGNPPGQGLKIAEGEYKDGKEEGLWTFWHDNGQKEKEGVFKDGKEEGLWTEWDENGKRID